MTAFLLPNGKQHYETAAGLPAVGWKIYTYDTGTNNPRVTWADAAQIAPNANPVVLDARGEASIFWNGAYRVRLEDNLGNTIWTQDGVSYVDSNSSLITDLANFANGAKGAGMVGFGPAVTYGGNSVGSFLNSAYGRTAAEIAGGVTPTNYFYDYANVLRYGADPTGAADSSSAFVQAIAALPATGGVIVVPPGKYKANFANVKPGVTIRGMGRYYESNAVGLYANNTASWVIDVGGTGTRLGDFHLEDIDVHGDELGDLGVRMRNCDHFKFTRCSIRGFRVMGIQVYGTNGQASTYGNFTDCSIATSSIAGSIGIQIKVDAGSYVIPVRMIGCDLHSTVGSSYVLDMDNTGGQGVLVYWAGVWCECGNNRGIRMTGTGAEICGQGDVDSGNSADSLVNISVDAYVSDFIRGNIRIDGVVTMPAGNTFALSGKAHVQNESFSTFPSVQGSLNFQNAALAGRLQTATGTQNQRMSRSGTTLFIQSTDGQLSLVTGGSGGSGSDAVNIGRQDGSDGRLRYTSTGILILSGAGSPEAAITAPIGSLYQRTNGGAGTSIYVKETGVGNTGWVGK